MSFLHPFLTVLGACVGLAVGILAIAGSAGLIWILWGSLNDRLENLAAEEARKESNR